MCSSFSLADFSLLVAFVVQASGWSLDSTRLVIEVGSDAGFSADRMSDGTSFVVSGLVLEGAAWSQSTACLALSDAIRSPLPPTMFKWYNADEVPSVPESQTMVTLPVYLNDSRLKLLFTVDLRAPRTVPSTVWEQRGAAVVAWQLHV